MIYHVRARFLEETAESLLEKLGDGTVGNQQPDGPELVASMNRAVVNENGVVEWSEMCFCPSPLRHERATILDQHFQDIVAEPVDAHTIYEGEPFLNYLKTLVQQSLTRQF